MPQVPVVHDGVEFDRAGQTLPQVPQLLISPPTERQVPAQFSWPVRHELSQRPPTQIAVPPTGSVHIAPHPPQFDALMERLTSQPSVIFALQSANPALHDPLQRPEVQIARAFVGIGQPFAQEPQLAASVNVLTQAPLQKVVGGVQTEVQLPVEQSVPEPHVRPQLPQLELLVFMSVSQPLLASTSQFAKPALQLAIVQIPAVHPLVALDSTHACEQLPQRVVVV